MLVACDYSQQVRLSQGGAVPAQSTANLRANLIQALIQFALTDRAASQLGVTASDARIAQVAASAKMPDGVSSTTRGLLTQYFHDSARAQLLQAAIGAHLRDPKITTADAVSPNDITAARPYLDKFAAKQSVTVDPSFGRWNGTRVVNTSGSLSVPATVTPTPSGSSSATAVKNLPQSQVCG